MDGQYDLYPAKILKALFHKFDPCNDITSVIGVLIVLKQESLFLLVFKFMYIVRLFIFYCTLNCYRVFLNCRNSWACKPSEMSTHQLCESFTQINNG